VTIDGLKFDASWELGPDGGVGIYHGNFDFNLQLFGDVTVAVVRQLVVAKVEGTPITTTCDNGLTNFNAWVGRPGDNIASFSSDQYALDMVGFCRNYVDLAVLRKANSTNWIFPGAVELPLQIPSSLVKASDDQRHQGP
jgi:hypothetical protein